MVFQDLVLGGGIGIIAPEQELLTEEIMPYIPENRIDDSVSAAKDGENAPLSTWPMF
jgi:hypothetical protein